jgi:hypothetical protein
MARLNIEGHLHRLVHGRHTFVWTRHYARIETAVQRCTAFLMLDGEVGDIIEFTLKINGYQVGTIRLKATGKMEVVWNRKEADKARNAALQLNKSTN